MPSSVFDPPDDGPIGYCGVADLHGHVLGADAELLGDDHGERRARAGADVLHRREELDRSVLVQAHLARRVEVDEAPPDRLRHADAALDRRRCRWPAGGACASRSARRRCGARPCAPRAWPRRCRRATAGPTRRRACRAARADRSPSFSASSSTSCSTAKAPIGCAGRAEGRRRPAVGEHVVLLRARVVAGVERACPSSRRRRRWRCRRCRARSDRDGGEAAVLLGAELQRLHRRRAIADAQVLLLAIEHEPHRRARLLRQVRREHAEGCRRRTWRRSRRP